MGDGITIDYLKPELILRILKLTIRNEQNYWN